MKNAAMRLALVQAIKESNSVTRDKTRATPAKPEHYILTVHNHGFLASTKNKTWKKPRITLGGKEWK